MSTCISSGPYQSQANVAGSSCSTYLELNLARHPIPYHSTVSAITLNFSPNYAACPCVRSDPEHPVISRFWSRLNESFPLLTSLLLRGPLYTTSPNSTVTFENLKILEWVDFKPCPTIRFPALRYLELGSIPSAYEMPRLMPWSHLESLLLRNIPFGFHVPGIHFQNLRMLGIPQVRGYSPLRWLPLSVPLQHLHVYVGSRLKDSHDQAASTYGKELVWLRKIIEKLPTVAEIVLCHTSRSEAETPIIQGDFKDEDLRLLNFFDSDSSAQRSDRMRVTLKRIRFPFQAVGVNNPPVPQRSTKFSWQPVIRFKTSFSTY
jgi:hypothetical protein